jgi:hypothetical protein
MRVFLTYLWKEWRDHRAVLVGMVLAVPALMVVAGLMLPSRSLDNEAFAPFVALACLTLFVVSLATDLVPGEARRGHRWLLERLPGGLGAAFRGKLVIFAGGAALFAAYGYFAGAATCRLVAGVWPAQPAMGTTEWIIAIAALWTFAVSCSLPRGALSLPAVAALVLLLALPAILLWMLYPSRGPEAWWRWESGALWTIGAVVASWAAFRRSGFLRAGRACLVVSAVCATPYWADAAHEAWDWSRHSVVHIDEVLLGEGGNYAFVNRDRVGANGSSHAAPVIIDLRTGAAREAGSKLSRFSAEWSGNRLLDHAFIRLWQAGNRDATALSGRTAERANPTVEDYEAASRARPLWRFPDGHTAWLRGGTLVTEAEGGGSEVLLKDAWSPCGLGLESWTPRGYYDLARRRGFAARDLALRGERVWIRPGAWLTRKMNEYRLFDPDTNAFAPALGFAKVADVAAILDDGRVIASCKDSSLALLVPETGLATGIATPPGFEHCFVWSPSRFPVRTPGGKRVLQLIHDDGSSDLTADRYACVFVRQEGDRFVATAATKGLPTLLGCPTDDTVLVHDHRAIYRLRFGSDEKEEIWRVR